MAPLKQTAFRLDAEDFAILDEIKQRMGLSSRSDALRFVLRKYSRDEGIGPAAKPKRKPRK